jgi:hypothetical protein
VPSLRSAAGEAERWVAHSKLTMALA